MTTMTAMVPKTATAMYDYDSGGKPGRLSLRKGDTVVVTEQKSTDWWVGTVGGQSGMFPAQYAKLNAP